MNFQINVKCIKLLFDAYNLGVFIMIYGHLLSLAGL